MRKLNIGDMLKKKGQSAMEYLMTYGWAILIVIVVVAALYAMGVFKGGTTVPCSPCFGGSDLAYVDHNLTYVKLRVGPRDLEFAGTPTASGSTFDYDISACGATWVQCEVTVTYIVSESGMQHSAAATLHNP